MARLFELDEDEVKGVKEVKEALRIVYGEVETVEAEKEIEGKSSRSKTRRRSEEKGAGLEGIVKKFVSIQVFKVFLF